MTLKISKFIVFVSVILVLAACGSQNDGSASSVETKDEKDVLKLATSADFPPFESRDPEGNYEGFDIDLAELIAKDLGYELEIEDMSFDGLIGALQADRVDMVMAGMSGTEERRENVDFSTEYNRSGEVFMYPSDKSFKKLENLKGKVVGVQLGTIQEEGAEELAQKYGFEVKKVDDAGMLVQELHSNRIDIAYMDKTVAVGYVDSQGFESFDDPTTSSPGMGIAFPKDSDLIEEVNEVIEKLENNGELEELQNKWLSDYQE